MNEKVLDKLEFGKIRRQLASMTSFTGGRQKALAISPSKNIETVTRLLDETAEAMEVLRFGEPGFWGELAAIDIPVAKARAGALLQPIELLYVYRALKVSRLAIKHFEHFAKCPRLTSIIETIYPNQSLERKLNQAIDNSGEIKDDASTELKRIRNQISVARTRIKDYLRDFIRSAGNQKILQEALVTERDGRYVVPIRQEYRYEVQGIVHDESASGATVFIEPLPVVEHNNRIRSLEREEKREIERILRSLSNEVTMFVNELENNLEKLAELDFILARARMAYNTNSFRPTINTRGIIDINRGRHPLLGKDAVPLDVKLGKEYDILVITGPNTGGKTVALKTIGLLTVMSMSGLFIPARENSCISIFDSLFVDIGDEQSIEQSLSTFSGHMTNIIEILKEANNRSLVLIDELGAGTDPVEGAALAAVILEELRRKQVKVVVTTHQSELKKFAYKNPRVENACVEFDPTTLKPTYKLTIGMPGQSNAFEIAGRLGLDKALVNKARNFVPQSERETSEMIRQLKESHANYEKARLDLETMRKYYEQQQLKLQEERKSFLAEKEAILIKAREEADQFLRAIKREANEAVEELKGLLKDSEKPPKWHEIEQKRQKLKRIADMDMGEEPQGAPNGQNGEIRPGDYVFIQGLGQTGYVLEGPNSQGEVTIQAGIMRLTVKQDQLRKTESPDDKLSRSRNQILLEKAKHISKEIDVRGKLAEEAIIEIDRYLEDANLVGLDGVRIIHGKGTGALRTAVRNYLKEHRLVKAFRDGAHNEGGYGVTVVEFR